MIRRTKYLKRSPIRYKPPKVKRPNDGREVLDKAEYQRNREVMYDRQKSLCALCGLWMSLEEATFEHERSRGHGGGTRDDSILYPDGRWKNAATHGFCNLKKASRRYAWDETNTKFLPVERNR